MKRYCVVRFDDVCPTMNKEYYEKAFSLMREYGIKPLLGVIPDNHDPEQIASDPRTDFWEYIKELQQEGYDIAMHGYRHVYDKENAKTILFGKKHSEFAGHTYEEQFERIKNGKQILNSHGIFTDVFFAPAHSYDKNTLKALAANGFKYISDGFSLKPYVQENVICVPCRLMIGTRGNGGIRFAVAHPGEWGKADKSSGYERLAAFCKENKEHMTSFSDLKTIDCGNYFVQKAVEKSVKIVLLLKKILRFFKKSTKK